MIDVAANLARVRERIAQAAVRAGRDPGEIILIGAAKKKPPELIEAAIAAGLGEIGENYVQEAAAKRPRITAPARWHMIGHLQRNKAKRAVELFDVVQSVDNLALGRALDRAASTRGTAVRILVEVNLGGETTKSGAATRDLPELITSLRELPHLEVQGLMTMPPPGEPEAIRPYFRQLESLAEEFDVRERSMGMTDDFEVAIEEGATMVRVGRAIFGERE